MTQFESLKADPGKPVMGELLNRVQLLIKQAFGMSVSMTDLVNFPGVPGSSVPSVPNIAQLSAVQADIGTIIFVVTVGDYFGLQNSNATADGITVVSGLVTGTQWIRMGIQSRAWTARTAWFVDPQATVANDENAGTTDFPLKTLTEVSRRLVNAVIPTGQLVTVTLNSNCLTTDKPVWTLVVQPGATSGDGFLLLGVPTVIYTGTVTGWVQQTQGFVAAADDNQLTDSAIPTSYTASGLIGSGLIFKRTNGTALWWYGIADLGGKTVRISDPLTSAGAITALAVNDTYTVSRLPKIYDMSFAPRTFGRFLNRIIIQHCDDNSTTTSSTGPSETACIEWDRSTRSTAFRIYNGIFINCGVWANVNQSGPGSVTVRGGACVGNGTGLWQVVLGGTLAFATAGACHFQGVELSADQSSNVSTAALFAFYDCTIDCIVIGTGCAGFLNNLKGKGNTALLIAVRAAGIMSYNHGSIPPVVDASTSFAASLRAGNTFILAAALPLVGEIPTRFCGIVDNA